MTLNPKFTFFLFIAFMAIGLIGFTHWQKVDAENKEIAYQEKLKQDKILEDSFIQVVRPTIEPTLIPYKMFSPEPIRIDNSLSLKQFYNWKSENASGLKDMNVSSTMYGYKEFTNFTYYDYNWGKYFEFSAPEGKEYFLAYIYTEMDDVLGGNDTRLWLPHQNQYGLLINDIMYYPVISDYEHNQIKEMDEIYNYNHVERIKPYGYEYIIAPDNETKVNTYQMMERNWLRGGKSNAEDGYIVFEIPKEHNNRLIRLYANFFSFGSASWKIV